MPGTPSLYIYAEPRCPVIDFEEIAAYARSTLNGMDVILRGPLLETSIDGNGPAADPVSPQWVARAMAQAKVRQFDAPSKNCESVLDGEVNYELRRLDNRESAVFGILYDGGKVARLMSEMMPPGESTIDQLHVVFTNQLIGTWDEGDLRYHARTALLGAPSIISVSGLVEAPARARGYYMARRNAAAFGFSEEKKIELASSFAEDCLSHNDVRLTEVAKGYVMQAVAYRISGVPFCDDEDCCLYNAHWQKELLRAQLGGWEFCDRHQELFEKCSPTGGAVFWT